MLPPRWGQPIDFMLIFSIEAFCDGVLNLEFISCEADRTFMIELVCNVLFFRSFFLSFRFPPVFKQNLDTLNRDQEFVR